MRYFPLDERLARPGWRILHALLRFDAASSSDLFMASCDREHERVKWAGALSQLVRRGHVERVPVKTRGYNERPITVSYYRITPAGRREVQQLRADYARAMEAA